MTMSAPHLCQLDAVARPMRVPAPVTIATCPLKLIGRGLPCLEIWASKAPIPPDARAPRRCRALPSIPSLSASRSLSGAASAGLHSLVGGAAKRESRSRLYASVDLLAKSFIMASSFLSAGATSMVLGPDEGGPLPGAAVGRSIHRPISLNSPCRKRRRWNRLVAFVQHESRRSSPCRGRHAQLGSGDRFTMLAISGECDDVAAPVLRVMIKYLNASPR